MFEEFPTGKQASKGASTSNSDVPESPSHDADQLNSLWIESLLVTPDQVPVVNDTTTSRTWNPDLASADDLWLPVELNFDYPNTFSEPNSEVDGWGVTPEISKLLIDLFFDNIQTWLTFVHRPTFNKKYMRQEGTSSQIVQRSAVSDDEAFMICCMFAMAARFTNSVHLQGVPVTDRGEVYANRATFIKDSIIKTIQEPSVEFLKGCVILSFYHLVAGQIGRGSVLTSVCVRFAYDLALDEVDEDQMEEDGNLTREAVDETPDVWLRKEELRRLWWSIWELDTFICTLSCQPYTIERTGMKVLLPVPDYNWLCGIPMRSAFIDHRPETVWKSLHGSPNQSARAWFLLANYLKSHILWNIRRPSRYATTTKRGLETALCNLKLSLPPDFHLRSLFLDWENYEQGNWIIATHLIIITCETILERSTWARHEHDDDETDSHTSAHGPTQFAKRITSYLYKIGQIWAPEYIPLCHPIICCAIVVPGSTDSQESDSASQAREVAKIILTHYAKYWKLGSEMLRLLSIIETGINPELHHAHSDERRLFLKQYSILLPTMSKRKSAHSAH